MDFLSQVFNHEKSETDDGDNFVILESSICLPLHIKDEKKKPSFDTVMAIANSEKKEKDTLSQIDCEVSIHQVENDGLIVKVIPPTEPPINQSRGPVEIVLLIDVSGSMDHLAPVPPSSEGKESEQKGFTVLDLTKHAACTLIESLNEHDTLCIVTFSTDCKVTTFLLLIMQRRCLLASLLTFILTGPSQVSSYGY
jgi:hypothetical protein